MPPATKIIIVKGIHIPPTNGPRTKEHIINFISQHGLELSIHDDVVEVYEKGGSTYNGIGTILYENFQGFILDPVHYDGRIPAF